VAFTQREYTDRAVLAAAIASHIADRLKTTIAETGRASLVVPGGTTPIAVFNFLSEKSLPWEFVTIIPCDERWVPVDHPDSNERLVRQHLLQGHAKSAQFVSLYRPRPAPADALVEIHQALLAVPRPFALVFLGMGEDGHFASLFPGRTETIVALDANAQESVMVLAEPANGYPRIGLTLSALVDSPRVLLAVTGHEKRIVLNRAIANINDDAIPVAALLRQNRARVDILLSV
jgi:6-phosphogluconolactonase